MMNTCFLFFHGFWGTLGGGGGGLLKEVPFQKMCRTSLAGPKAFTRFYFHQKLCL